MALIVILFFFSASSLFSHTDLTPEEAYDRILAGGQLVVLDVREYAEFCDSLQHIEDATNLPWNSSILQNRFGELPIDWDIIVLCRAGGRSHSAADFLDAQGFTSIYDMTGGMLAWTYETEACTIQSVLKLVKTAGGDVEINWTATTGTQDYDLLRGDVANLFEGGSFVGLGPIDCLAKTSIYTYFIDNDLPAPGGVFFYLSRRTDASWGLSSSGQERIPGSPECD